jgi:hypothetical protein
MKYIYTNVTSHIQTLPLATKNQDSVGARTFMPGASLTLDYPGFNLYVPNTLSCVIIDTDFVDTPVIAPKVIEVPVVTETKSEPSIVIEHLENSDIIVAKIGTPGEAPVSDEKIEEIVKTLEQLPPPPPPITEPKAVVAPKAAIKPKPTKKPKK